MAHHRRNLKDKGKMMETGKQFTRHAPDLTREISRAVFVAGDRVRARP